MRKESSNTLALNSQSKSKCRAFLLVALATIFAVFGIYLVTGCGKSAKRFSVKLPVLEVEGLYKIKPLSPTQKLSSGSKFKFSITFDKDIDPESVRVQANLDVLTPISKTSPNPPTPEETDGNAVKETVAGGGAEEDEQGTTAEWGDTYTYSTTIISDTFIVLGELPYYTHDLQVTETPPHITISYCGMGGLYDESIAVQLYPVESWQGTYPGLGVGFDVATGYVLYVTLDLSGYTDTTIHTAGLSQLAHTEKNNFHKFTFVVVGKTDDPVSITWDGTPKEYTMGEIPGQVTVKSGEQDLHSGDKVYYDQELTIAPIIENTDENVEEILEVKGATKLNKANTYRVTGDVSILYEKYDKPTLDTFTFEYKPSQSGGYYSIFFIRGPETVVIPGSYNDGTHGEHPVIIDENSNFQEAVIKKLVFNPGITSIGARAFKNSLTINIIKLPSTLKSIGEDAFLGCSSVEIINNSPLELTLGSENFGRVAELSCVIVTDESKSGDFNKVYDGMKYYENTYQNKLVALGFEDPKTAPSTLTFKEGTVGVGHEAFEFCNNITNIEFPSGRFNVCAFAFSSCKGLTEITLPDDVVLGIGALRFTNLQTITLPKNLTYIHEQLLYECKKLRTVNFPQNLKGIGDFAFYWCDVLGTDGLELPSTVEVLGNSAFRNSNNIVMKGLPASLKRIEDEAFSNCPHAFTNLVVPDSVTYIGASAFQGCQYMQSATLSSGLKTLAGGTFMECTSLQTIDLRNITEIRQNAFTWCTKLSLNSLPNSITQIGFQAFSGCSGLVSMTLPSSLTMIGESAFQECTGLQSVTLQSKLTVTPNPYNEYIYPPFMDCFNIIEVVSKLNANDTNQMLNDLGLSDFVYALLDNENQKGSFNVEKNGIRYYENTHLNMLIALGFVNENDPRTTLELDENTMGLGYKAFNLSGQIKTLVIPKSFCLYRQNAPAFAFSESGSCTLEELVIKSEDFYTFPSPFTTLPILSPPKKIKVLKEIVDGPAEMEFWMTRDYDKDESASDPEYYCYNLKPGWLL